MITKKYKTASNKQTVIDATQSTTANTTLTKRQVQRKWDALTKMNSEQTLKQYSFVRVYHRIYVLARSIANLTMMNHQVQNQESVLICQFTEAREKLSCSVRHWVASKPVHTTQIANSTISSINRRHLRPNWMFVHTSHSTATMRKMWMSVRQLSPTMFASINTSASSILMKIKIPLQENARIKKYTEVITSRSKIARNSTQSAASTILIAN